MYMNKLPAKKVCCTCIGREVAVSGGSTVAILISALLIPAIFSMSLDHLLIKAGMLFTLAQRANKVVSDSLGLVEFDIGLVNSVLNLPIRQVKVFEEFKLQKNCEINCAHQNVFGAS